MLLHFICELEGTNADTVLLGPALALSTSADLLLRLPCTGNICGMQLCKGVIQLLPGQMPWR